MQFDTFYSDFRFLKVNFSHITVEMNDIDDETQPGFAKSNQAGLELKFNNLNYSIGNRIILDDVSGTAKAGQMMAIMGPSGN